MKLLSKRELGIGEFFQVDVVAYGTTKRQRKNRTQVFNLGYIPIQERLTQEDENYLRQEAKDKLSETMREVKEMIRVKLEVTDIGTDFLTWSPFDQRNLEVSL